VNKLHIQPNPPTKLTQNQTLRYTQRSRMARRQRQDMFPRLQALVPQMATRSQPSSLLQPRRSRTRSPRNASRLRPRRTHFRQTSLSTSIFRRRQFGLLRTRSRSYIPKSERNERGGRSGHKWIPLRTEGITRTPIIALHWGSAARRDERWDGVIYDK
jgi:hypothetical protein